MHLFQIFKSFSVIDEMDFKRMSHITTNSVVYIETLTLMEIHL